MYREHVSVHMHAAPRGPRSPAVKGTLRNAVSVSVASAYNLDILCLKGLAMGANAKANINQPTLVTPLQAKRR